ncbi:hypothetical protein V5H98_18170 [Georgenia sp. M64]|uniref:hypothetical protein n=1 Tax=Georgenia sp. M64 TaxID=3120520 RepID=UPI0030DEB2D9
MSVTPARPDLAYVNAVRIQPAQLVAELRDLLGARLVAYLGGVKETRAVRQWAEGTRRVSAGDLRRLRLAYQAARLLAERDTPAVVQAWFQGLNPALEDRSPARVLREGDVDDVGPAVLAAARQFAAVG